MHTPTRRPISPSGHTITLLGGGNMGFAIALLLRRTGHYHVCVADHNPASLARFQAMGFDTALVDNEAALQQAIHGRYAVLNALPFHRAVAVATLCAQAGVHYFDLTEDVAATHAIQQLAPGARSVLMPQCGLAPGFIGVVGHDLAGRFGAVDELHMRVGALPRYPNNSLRYNLTWSTEGLINEYCNPCEALVDGEPVQVAALEGLETFVLDGVSYEAFNTSGGLGTLTQTLRGRARQVDYKSVRYPGHCAIMKLLLNELRLRERRALLQDILEAALPSTAQDVVVVFATAQGQRGQRLVQESFAANIVGQTVDGHRLSAIQLTTAAGICTALDLVAHGQLPAAGFVGQEQISLDVFLSNRFGRVYAGQGLSPLTTQTPLTTLPTASRPGLAGMALNS